MTYSFDNFCISTFESNVDSDALDLEDLEFPPILERLRLLSVMQQRAQVHADGFFVGDFLGRHNVLKVFLVFRAGPELEQR